MSNEFTSENHWQITSRVTKKSLFTVTNKCIIYYLHFILCPKHTILIKTIIDRSFHHCHQRRSFWLSIVTSSQLICDIMQTRGTIIVTLYLSGVPDYFDRNKILSGYDLSHYQVPHCIRVFFYFVWFVFIHHNFQFYFKLCTYCNILDIYLS